MSGFYRSTDFWAGLMFLGIGAMGLFIARDYPLGSALRMGAGYLPTALSGILILFGIYIVLKSVIKHEKIQGNWSIRALIVLPGAMVLFGLLLKYTGFLPALVILIFVSATAGREFKLIEVLLFTALLTILCIAVFIWGLGLSYPLVKLFD